MFNRNAYCLLLLCSLYINSCSSSKKPSLSDNLSKNLPETIHSENIDIQFDVPYIVTLTPISSSSDKSIDIRVFAMKSPGIKLDEKVFLKAISEKFNIFKHIDKENAKVDINLFLEHSKSDHIKYAKNNWILVNQEQIFFKDLPGIDLAFCRHSLCTDLLRKMAIENKFKYSVKQISFSSFADKNFEFKNLNFDVFSHPAGKSPYKNTKKVLNVWKNNPDLPKLYVTCYGDCEKEAFHGDHKQLEEIKNLKNVVYYDSRLEGSPFEFIEKIGFVVAPSAVEGYGHYINEVKGRGGIVITTDANPMNELIKPEFGFLLPVTINGYYGNARSPLNEFKEEDLLKSVRKAMSLTESKKKDMSIKARESYRHDYDTFQKTINDMLEHYLQNK